MFDSEEFENVFGKEANEEMTEILTYIADELEAELERTRAICLMNMAVNGEIALFIGTAFLVGAYWSMAKELRNPIISKEENKIVDDLLGE